MFDVADEIDRYLQRLFPLCRSITGGPNRETLGILQEIVPLTIHEVPSGTKVYDWVIPDEWTVRDAWIADKSGQRIVDFKANNLHIVSYSIPIDSTMHWEELKPHIHKHPQLPDAIPYRTSYYQRNWGFCVTGAQYQLLAKATEPLTVMVDTELKPGSLSYGEYLLPGESKKEILISCYICHPSMANDNLSGVLLTAFLARHVAKLEKRKWSYRFVFTPETIGAVAYCARNETAMRAIDFGVVITTVGGPGKYGYKQSLDSSHHINTIIEDVFNENDKEFIKYPFDIHGSDERQYSSQAFRINTATICRDRYYEYPYYHTSLDDLNFVDGSQISETYGIYVELIKKIERLRYYQNLNPSCEAMLSRHNCYPSLGGTITPSLENLNETDIILWTLFLSDGTMPIQLIAKKLGVELMHVQQIVNKLITCNLLAEI